MLDLSLIENFVGQAWFCRARSWPRTSWRESRKNQVSQRKSSKSLPGLRKTTTVLLRTPTSPWFRVWKDLNAGTIICISAPPRTIKCSNNKILFPVIAFCAVLHTAEIKKMIIRHTNSFISLASKTTGIVFIYNLLIVSLDCSCTTNLLQWVHHFLHHPDQTTQWFTDWRIP